MPIFLIIVGILFITASVRGKACGEKYCHTLLFDTLKDDFTGPNNFIYWGLSLFIIGMIGYNKTLRPLANSFLVLVIIVLFIRNKGFFEQFIQQISATQRN
jgi:hypothetical protein